MKGSMMLKKVLLILSGVALFFSFSLQAASYKGQRVYSKRCVKCHGRQDFIESKTRKQWKKLMKHKGQKLAELHLNSKKAKKSWRYFKSKRFKRKAKHLKDFLIEYAKDSGRVPACN